MKIIRCDRPTTKSIGNGLERTWMDWEVVFSDKRGFVFDGASIPRPAWSILGLTPHGDMDAASLPHDDIYQHQGKLPILSLFQMNDRHWTRCDEKISRSTADSLLYEICAFFGIGNAAQRFAVWSAVRIFGWYAWWRDDVKRKNKLQGGF